jgi:hypothetical protein
MRNLLITLVLVVLLWSGTAVGSSLPYARRSNGDPDEFQARQVMDEGIVLGRAALDAGSSRGAAAGRGDSGDSVRRRDSKPVGADDYTGRGRLVVSLPGKRFFLER